MKNQIIKFLITGTFTTSINYTVFFILYHFLYVYYILSSAIGYITGVFISYVINKRWTFSLKDKLISKLEIIKYFGLHILSLVVSLIVLKITVKYLGIMVEIANVISIAFATTINFLGMKFFIFKK